MRKINRELENSRINSIMALNKTTEKPPRPQKEQRIPRWKQWEYKKVLTFRFKKLLPERELTREEVPDELRVCVLEYPEVEKVFSHPSYKENDSSTVFHKLEIKSYIKVFKLFEFFYMKQLPIENSE